MARLGELLVGAGLVTAEQVEQALRAQVIWGGRLGTNLVELGHLELDPLTQVLARQHRLPAALERHFDRADAALQQLVPPALAERRQVIPLVRIGPDREQLAIAAIAPLDPMALAELADALGVPPSRLVPSIAAELRIAYHLERVYKIPRDLRFLRPRNKIAPAFLQFDLMQGGGDSDSDVELAILTQELPVMARPATAPVSIEIPIVVEMPPEPAPAPAPAAERPARRATTARNELAELAEDLSALAILDDDPGDADDGPATEHDRRRYVRTIADEPSSDSERLALGRISLRRIPVAGAGTRGAAGESLVEAVRAIRRSTDRDRVADLVIDALDRFVPACGSAILLVKRGDVAIGWKGFARTGAPLCELGVPLDAPSGVLRAIEREAPVRVAAAELGPIDEILRAALGEAEGELAIVPISIAGDVMCAIAAVATLGADLAPIEALAGAAGAAFARLMRAASR